MRFLLGVMMLLPMLARPARADDDGALPETLQELFLLETVYPQEAWELQVTLSGAGEHRAELDVAETRLGVELGITDRLQLEVGLPLTNIWTAVGHRVGFGNVEAGVLYNVLAVADPELGLSVSLEGEFPSVHEEVGEDAFGIEPNLIFHLGLGPLRVLLNGGVEVELPTEDGETEVAGATGLGLFMPIGPVIPTLEVAALLGEERQVRAAAGLVWKVAPGWEVGGAGFVGSADGLIGGGRLLLIFEQELADGDPDDR